METKEQILQEHLSFKRTSVQSIDKIKDIERYIKKFLNSTSKPLNQFNEKDLTDFLSSMNDTYSIGTINNVKVYLKVFLKWHFEDYSTRFRNLDKICRNQTAPKSILPNQLLSFDEVEKLIKGESELEWKVFWSVFFYGGFRPSECVRLKWNEVQFDKEGVILKVFLTKNKKRFYKSLPDSAGHFLKEWRKFNSSEWVFPSPLREGKPMGRKTAYFRLKKLSKRVLGREIYPYILRHSLATIKYNDANLRDKDDLTANQLGHSKSMKQTYSHLDEGKLIANARKIWAKADKLPPEKKHELEEKIKVLSQTVQVLCETNRQIIELIFKVDADHSLLKQQVRKKELSFKIEEIANKLQNLK